GVEASVAAACAVRTPGRETDELAIFFSPRTPPTKAVDRELLSRIRARVLRGSGVNPDYLVPVPQDAIPKTSIGKIQRSQLVTRFAKGEFDATIRAIELASNSAKTIPAWFYRPVWIRSDAIVPGPRPDGTVLVFADRHGAGDALAARLRRSYG